MTNQFVRGHGMKEGLHFHRDDALDSLQFGIVHFEAAVPEVYVE